MKPRPGVCDVCGGAVVLLSFPPTTGYVNGHFYQNGKLQSVRCSRHPQDDMAPLAKHDAFGGGRDPGWRHPRGTDGEM